MWSVGFGQGYREQAGIKLAKAGWGLGISALQTDGLLAEQDTICSKDLGDATRKWMQKAAHKPRQ